MGVSVFSGEAELAKADVVAAQADDKDKPKPDGADKDGEKPKDEKPKDGENAAQADDSKKPPGKDRDLTDLSLEELLSVKVTTVSRKEESVSQTNSAVYVLTQEDIRRSGATHVAEALRMVPGLNVARANSNKWAVTARGFQSVFANKLLVMVDGRTIYSPFFAGVYWNRHEMVLEDIERIEVVRGPGATVWGSNAVNGVINIITKSSQETQGGLGSGLGGTEERAISSVRYGGKLNKDVTWRVYAKYANRDDTLVSNIGRDNKDEWDNVRGGFKVDWVAGKDDTVTFQGDHFSGLHEQQAQLPVLTAPFTQKLVQDAHFSGTNLLARWNHKFSDKSDMSLQVYWDRNMREETFLDQFHDTGDIDFNHHLQLGMHDIVYGAGYRIIAENLTSKRTTQVIPERDTRSQYNLFAQDEMEVVKDRLKITLGSKFEYNDITGFEVQPTVRFLWTPHKKHTVWAATSRAVRMTTRNEYDVRLDAAVVPLPTGEPLLVSLVPGPKPDSEEVIANELGYRAQLHKRFSLDFASFYNLYDKLRTAEFGATVPEASPAPPHLLLPIIQGDKASGESYGAELAASWAPLDRWRLSAGYSLFFLRIHRDDDTVDPTAESQERSNPQNQFHLRSFLTLPHRVELDTALYYVDHIPQLNIPSYIRVDARVGWHATKDLELSISGQNLLDNRHPETGPAAFERPSEIERSFYFKLTWKF